MLRGTPLRNFILIIMIIVYTAVESSEEAKKIAKKLLELQLIACCNIFPKITSLYSWKDDIIEDDEFVLFCKTIKKYEKDVFEVIRSCHSYTVPAIYSWKVRKVNSQYKDWLMSSLKQKGNFKK